MARGMTYWAIDHKLSPAVRRLVHEFNDHRVIEAMNKLGTDDAPTLEAYLRKVTRDAHYIPTIYKPRRS